MLGIDIEPIYRIRVTIISSEIEFQDKSCTNHSLVAWTACLGRDLNPGLQRSLYISFENRRMNEE